MTWIQADQRSIETRPEPKAHARVVRRLEPFLRSELRFARDFARIELSSTWAEWGCGSVVEYGTRHGYRASQVRAWATLGKALAAVPELETRILDHRIPLEHAEIVAPLMLEAALEGERDEWLHLAERTSARRLRSYVSRRIEQIRQARDDLAAITVWAPISTRSEWHRAVDVASTDVGRNLSEGEAFCHIIGFFLDKKDPLRRAARQETRRRTALEASRERHARPRAGECVSLTTASRRAASPDGASPRGASPGGVSTGGSSTESVSSRAASPEGVSPEAVSHEPVSPEAVSPEAVSHEAVSPEAVSHEAVSPEAVSPEAVSPEAVSPEAVSPEAVSPEAVSPEAVSHEAVSPEAVSPEAVSHEAVSPEAVSPEAVSPEAVSPEAVSPEAVSPEAVSTEAVSPEAVSPEAVSPEAVSREAVSREAVSREAVSREAVSREAVSREAVSLELPFVTSGATPTRASDGESPAETNARTAADSAVPLVDPRMFELPRSRVRQPRGRTKRRDGYDRGNAGKAGGNGSSSRSRYVPMAVQRQLWLRASGVCEMPGCGCGRNLQICHIRGWAQGGSNGRWNLLLLCPRHHLLLDAGKLRFLRWARDGRPTFRMPDGTVLKPEARAPPHSGRSG